METDRESTETETERVVEELIISTIPFLPSSPEQTIQNKTSAQYQNTILTIKREREGDRQTDRQTETDRQAGRQADRQRQGHTERQTETERAREKDYFSKSINYCNMFWEVRTHGQNYL